MKKYNITVTQLVDDEELDYDDEMEFGCAGEGEVAYSDEMEVEDGEDEEDVLDRFHSTVPIAMLEHYEIDVEEVSTECVREV